jgi:Concanavalin A-like lectin/glucanases superfamily
MGLLSTIGAASGRAFGFTRSVITTATDAFFNRVTLLLPGNGTNGAQNNTFLDSSTNNFTITRNGNTTQGTFSPFSQTGWSNYFPNASNESVGVTSTNAAFALGTGDFTIECWVCPTKPDYAQGFFHINTSVNSTVNGYGVGITSAGLVQYYGASTFTNTNVTVTSGLWYHIALVRSSGTLRIYINGVSPSTGGSISDSQNLGNSVCYIGLFYATTGFCMTGYVSNFRVTKGGALYTSSFTPSTTPLTTTVSSGTVSFLTSQSNRFVDNSAIPLTLTIAGSPSIQPFSPFAPTAAYSAATVGGSGYFDGSGDTLAPPNNAAFAMSNGAFTIEFWFYTSSISQTGYILQTDVNSTALYVSFSSSTLRLTDQNTTYVSTPTLVANQWYHIAVVRSGTGTNQTVIYTNGVAGTAGTCTQTFTQAGPVIGGNGYLGYISNFRMVKGTAVYSSNFTPPTAPVTAITNTQLLLDFTNAGITDATAKNDLETVGNAQISTTQSKFGGSSMYFDGTGDYLRVPYSKQWALGGDFTIECWLYWTAHDSFGGVVGCANSNTGAAITAGWFFNFNGTTNKLQFEGQGGVAIVTTNDIPSGQWNHVAVVRSGSTITHYLNGTANGSGTSSTTFDSNTEPLLVGVDRGFTAEITGYIDDLRITRYARYTSNFTAPTAAFALQ